MKGYKADRNSKLVGLIGNPLDHTLSPKIHNFLYEHYDINAVYYPLELDEENLAEFISAAKVLRMSGFGVTMPFKGLILPYIDDAEEAARVFNCVNQVEIRPDGTTYGYSSDGYGLCQAVSDYGFDIRGKSALIIGAGAISGIIGYDLAQRGAEKAVILNRNREKATFVAETLAENTGLITESGPLEDKLLDLYAESSDLVIQCTSLGMVGCNDDFKYLGFLDRLPDHAFVADAIYNPGRTSFLTYAENRGLPVVNGVPMFIRQLKKNLIYNVGFTGVEDEGLHQAQQLMESELAKAVHSKV